MSEEGFKIARRDTQPGDRLRHRSAQEAQVSMNATAPDPIGVLVVHGIGAQERGETLQKLLDGLRRVAPESLPERAADGLALELEGQRLRLYEVYWADLLKGDVVRGSFVLDELISLSWFPWLNYRRKVYRKDSYAFFTVLWWMLALPLASWLMMLAYQGASLLVRMWDGLRNRTPPPRAGSLAERVQRTRQRTREYSAVDGLLDEYAGDVLNYVNSAGEAYYRRGSEKPPPEAVRRAYPAIVDRFYGQLLRAQSDGCKAIHVVAHSLGTVVTYHALRGWRFDAHGRADADAVRRACGRVEHLYTIGSPLEKIRFFWPRLMPSVNLAGRRRIAWDNFVSWFDPVAGVLRRFDEWGGVDNHRLLGGGFIRGHVVYEHSPMFLGALTKGLAGKALPMRRSVRQRVRDGLILLGETLGAPLGLLVVLLAGAAVFGLTIVILPFLISLPFRPFFGPEIWGPILDWSALIVGAMMVLSLSLAPLLRAYRVHALYWAERSDDAAPAPLLDTQNRAQGGTASE